MADIYKDLFKKEKKPFNVPALLCMIFGILSLLACLGIFPFGKFFGIVFAIVALILVRPARKKQPYGNSAMTKAGQICAIISLSIRASLMLVSLLIALAWVIVILLLIYFIIAAAIITVLILVLL
ncbi:MAG: hypothetical protein IJF08_01255 [Clostridia bacterium]|nr:hypothetical protein [Clostridia bacterium]